MKSLDENTKRLNMHLGLLSQIEPTDVNFLTCFLDTSGDRRQIQARFISMQSKFRQTLSGRNLIDFDHAVKMIEVYLENYDTKANSIMIFCRGILGGQYFLTIPLSEHLDNQIIFRPTPSISTLASLVKHRLEENSSEHWNINVILEDNAHVINQDLTINKHLERDENSYSLTHDEMDWPSGAPVALQARNQNIPANSLDLVA